MAGALLAVVPHHVMWMHSDYPPDFWGPFFVAMILFSNVTFLLAGPISMHWDAHGPTALSLFYLLVGVGLSGFLIFVAWLYPVWAVAALFGMVRWHVVSRRYQWQRLSLPARALIWAIVLAPAVIVWNVF